VYRANGSDGIKDLKLGAVFVVQNGSYLAPAPIATTNGTLTVTGWDAVTTDLNGDSASGSLAIKIIDDAPSAFAPTALDVTNAPGAGRNTWRLAARPSKGAAA
jgi:hypothetical protein